MKPLLVVDKGLYLKILKGGVHSIQFLYYTKAKNQTDAVELLLEKIGNAREIAAYTAMVGYDEVYIHVEERLEQDI